MMEQLGYTPKDIKQMTMKQLNVFFDHMRHQNEKEKNRGGSGAGGRVTAKDKIAQRRLEQMFGGKIGRQVM